MTKQIFNQYFITYNQSLNLKDKEEEITSFYNTSESKVPDYEGHKPIQVKRLSESFKEKKWNKYRTSEPTGKSEEYGDATQGCSAFEYYKQIMQNLSQIQKDEMVRSLGGITAQQFKQMNLGDIMALPIDGGVDFTDTTHQVFISTLNKYSEVEFTASPERPENVRDSDMTVADFLQ